MKTLALSELLAHFPSDIIKAKIQAFALRDDVEVLALTRKEDGSPKAVAFPSIPKPWPADVEAVWLRYPSKLAPKVREPRATKPQAEVVKSRTMQALDLIADGMTAYAAAKKLDISEAAISRAISRRKDKPICPHCNQVIR